MKEFSIDCDGIGLHAKLEMPSGMGDEMPPDGAKCPLLIVIHGFTGHMEEPHIVAAARSASEAGFAALRVEMYGHGKSGGSFQNHDLYKWVINALRVIDYAKGLDFVSDLYLCGHSQGGLLAMLAAGMKPDDIKALIPLAPAWMIPDGAREGFLLGQHFDPQHIPDKLNAWGRELDGNYLRVAQTIHPEEEIARYHGPVLIVQGDADEAVPLAYAEKAAQLYENAELVIIPGDTHCYDHHLETVTDAIKGFLLKHR